MMAPSATDLPATLWPPRRAPKRRGRVLQARKTNSLNDVGDAGGAHDDGWLAVNHAVPDLARSGVVRIIRGEDGAAEDSAQPGKLVS